MIFAKAFNTKIITLKVMYDSKVFILLNTKVIIISITVLNFE